MVLAFDARCDANVLRAMLIATSACLSACSLLLDTSAQQCTTDGDCAARGGSFAKAVCSSHVCVAPPTGEGGSGGAGSTGGTGGAGGSGGDADTAADPVWGCLGKVVMGTPQTQSVNVTVPFFDLINMKPFLNVGIRACPKLDVTCSRPIGPVVAADSAGIATISVPALFDGYAQVVDLVGQDAGDSDAGNPDASDLGDAPSAESGGSSARLIPSLLFFNPPLVKDTQYRIVPLFGASDIQVLAAAEGNTWDQSQHGMLFTGMLDCSLKPAAGVTWDASIVDASSRRFYLINGLPDEAASATDSSGFGGLLNAPPGTITITATVRATGKRIGSATVLVRPGVASYTYLAPTP
jgi:hypothetical protein